MRPEPYTYFASLLKCVDGDTIDVKLSVGFYLYFNIRLRLARINAAEMNSTDPLEREAAVKARDWLVKWLPTDKPFLVRTVDAREKYGRFLAELFVDGLNLNDLMIHEGIAKPYGDKT